VCLQLGGIARTCQASKSDGCGVRLREQRMIFVTEPINMDL
jgi:hypothetical protein